MPFSHLDYLECSAGCTERYYADKVNGLCRCEAPLFARYRLNAVEASVTREMIAVRPPSLWRYHELLPVRDPGRVVSLGEGMTPLLPLPGFGKKAGVPRLLVKDEGLIPTGTFKARGAAVGISRAVELGVRGIAMSTNGNAGAAWSAYAARAGIRSLIAMPEDAPDITRRECVVTGAELYLVRGQIGDAGGIITAAVAESASTLADVSTLKEPYRLEGKKTMGYEIAEQLGWRCPDVIVYPTGGGVGLIGVYKALLELSALGWISGPLPRLAAVQATGCAPVVDAFARRRQDTVAWADARTVAFGITVPKPLGDFLILDALYQTEGTAVAVTDEMLLQDLSACAELDGIFVCPEGAAAISAVRVLRESGWLSESDEVVVLNTGAGLKYAGTVQASVPVLDPGDRIPPGGDRDGC